jgi:hypothetical protein
MRAATPGALRVREVGCRALREAGIGDAEVARAERMPSTLVDSRTTGGSAAAG